MDSDVEKVKDRFSIVDVVSQYVQLRKAGRNWAAKCPFHKERTPSFMVSPERGTYICFGCGEKGDIFSFVQKMDGIDFPTALRQLAERAGVALSPRAGRSRLPEDKERDERLYAACEEAAKFFEAELMKRADTREYVRGRGVRDETAALWRLGYAPAQWDALTSHLGSIGFTNEEMILAGVAIKSERSVGAESRVYDRFRGRLMFPLFDAGGRVIAFSGRFLEKMAGSKEEGEPAKYVNSPETAIFKKSRVLYGLDRARGAIRKADCILLVEGQFDLVLAHQSGLSFTVALSGTALTPEHMSLLSRLSKRLVLSLDADEAGLRAGQKSALMALSAGFDVKVPTLPEGKDPADLAREDPELLKTAVRSSKPAVEFFLDALRHRAKDERAYHRIVEVHILPLVAAIESRIDREYWISFVARRLGVSAEAVREEVNKRPHSVAPSEYAQTDTAAAVAEQIGPLEQKVGMLLFYFGADGDIGGKLVALVGKERLTDIERSLAPRAEELRFKFEQELGEPPNEIAVAEDVLRGLDRMLNKEKLQAAKREDPHAVERLAKHSQRLRE